MNLLSPGELMLAVRRRSFCSVPPVVIKGEGGGSEVVSSEVLSKKEKRRRRSLNEPSPSRKASFFQR